MTKQNNNKPKLLKTINFDRIVLEKLENRAKRDNSSVSNIVNFLCRKFVLTDEGYFNELAKHHYLEFQRYKYLAEEAKIVIEMKNTQ